VAGGDNGPLDSRGPHLYAKLYFCAPVTLYSQDTRWDCRVDRAKIGLFLGFGALGPINPIG